MRPFERVRFDLRNLVVETPRCTRLSRELSRKREREQKKQTINTFLKWRTNYNFLPTFTYIYILLSFLSRGKGGIIFLSLVKNKLIAKKVFVAGKSLSRYLGCRSSGKDDSKKRRRRWSGCWGIDKPASSSCRQQPFDGFRSRFFFFYFQYRYTVQYRISLNQEFRNIEGNIKDSL